MMATEQAKELHFRTAHGGFTRVRWTPEGLEYQDWTDKEWRREIGPSGQPTVRAEVCPGCACPQARMAHGVPGEWPPPWWSR